MGIAHWAEIGSMDDLGRMDSPVHRIDARAKAVVTLVFIAVVMSFGRHEISALMPFFLYPASLLAIGRVPFHLIARKVLIAAPFALAVGIFNPILDREALTQVGPWIISSGWMSFGSIMVRFILTVSSALALVACTGMHRLSAGLERLGMPRVFATQLLFLYRYLFVVSEEGSTMLRSVELRSGGLRFLSLHNYGSLLGHLLLRSMDRADRIHRAMVARGFDGEVRLMKTTVLCWNDMAFIAGWVSFFALARMWNLSDLLGRLLTGIS